MRVKLNERLNCIRRVNELLSQNDLLKNDSCLKELIGLRTMLQSWQASSYVYKIDQFLHKPLLQRFEFILNKYRIIKDSEEAWRMLVQLNTDIELLDIFQVLKGHVP